MGDIIIPKNYTSDLNLHDTQIAIKTVKDFFQNLLALRLNLSRVSAPLFVDPASGLNDNLNGVERPVSFDILEQDRRIGEVVHSLAKWTRYALDKYSFEPRTGCRSVGLGKGDHQRRENHRDLAGNGSHCL